MSDNKKGKVMKQKKTIFVFTAALFMSVSLYAQDLYENYKFDMILQAVETSADAQTVVQRLTPVLKSFYYENAKVTEEPVLIDPLAPPDYREKYQWDTNARRLYLRQNLLEEQASFLIREAPNIFQLHLELARAYAKLRDLPSALYHYEQAQRFRSMKLTPEVWANEDRLNLLGSESVRANADQYRETQTSLRQAGQAYEKLKTELFLEEDKFAKTNSIETTARLRAENDQKLQEERKRLESLRSNMERELNNYRKEETQYNRTSANFLLEMALVLQELGEKTREDQAVKNSSYYYQNAYNQTGKQNWGAPENQTDYSNLLAAATSLDPNNPRIPLLLARSYENQGDTLRAIGAYEQTLESVKSSGQSLEDEQTRDVYLSLGGLYHTMRRYVDSAYFYEKALALDRQTGNLDRNLLFQTARLHALHTGNYPRSLKMFEALLKDAPPVNDDIEVSALAKNIRYQLAIRLLMVDAQVKSPELANELIQNLDVCQALHRKLESLIDTQEKLLAAQKEELVTLNRRMAGRYDRGSVQELYRVQGNYEQTKLLLEELYQARNSANFKKIYFTMARQNEKMHQIDQAILAYREAERLGLDPELARREVDRLTSPR